MSTLAPFSPVPARAMADHRLSAGHFRVLCCIAGHDRFSKNGVGCFASHKKMAQETGLHEVSISRLIADLVQWGYLESGRSPINRRQRTYRLIYLDNPQIVNELANDQNVEANETVILNELAKATLPILNIENGHPIEKTGVNSGQYIRRSLKEENIPLSGENPTAALRGVPVLATQPYRLQLGELLERVIRVAKISDNPANRKAIISALYVMDEAASDETHAPATTDARLLQLFQAAAAVAA